MNTMLYFCLVECLSQHTRKITTPPPRRPLLPLKTPLAHPSPMNDDDNDDDDDDDDDDDADGDKPAYPCQPSVGYAFKFKDQTHTISTHTHFKQTRRNLHIQWYSSTANLEACIYIYISRERYSSCKLRTCETHEQVCKRCTDAEYHPLPQPPFK